MGLIQKKKVVGIVWPVILSGACAQQLPFAESFNALLSLPNELG